MNRRALLERAGACGVILAAGCLSPGSRSNQPSSSVEGEGRSLSSDVGDLRARCDGARPVGTAHVDGAVYEHEKLQLEVCPETVAKGDEITFELVNASDSPLNTGNSSKYFVQKSGDDGWTAIVSEAEPERSLLFNDDAVLQQPGEGFRWTGEVSRRGLSRSVSNGLGTLVVCSPLEPGEYRFVYFGTLGQPLATRFTVEADESPDREGS